MSVFLMMNRGRDGRGIMGVSARDLKEGEDMMSYAIEFINAADKREAACHGHEEGEWQWRIMEMGGSAGRKAFRKEKRCVRCDKFFHSQQRPLTWWEGIKWGWNYIWPWRDRDAEVCTHARVKTKSTVFNFEERWYWRECAKCHKPMSHFHMKPLKKWHGIARHVAIVAPFIVAIVALMATMYLH